MRNKTSQILLVEDNEAHVELIRRAFEPEDKKFNLTVAGTLAEARKILKKTAPDLMIVDYLLPDGNGIELLPGYPSELAFPVIMLSGHGDEKVAIAAMKTGAMDYIVKSDQILADTPHTAERILRKWQHITRRKQAEKALQEAQVLNQSLLEGSPVCNKVIDLDFKLRYMSAAGVKRLKIPDIKSYYGQEYPPRFFHESTRIALIKHLKIAMAGKSTNVEAPAHDTEGGKVWYDTTFVPALDDDGQVKYIIATSMDITERKRTEKFLKQHEHQQMALTKLGLAALKGLELGVLLQNTTGILTETLDVEYCKVLELQVDGKSLLLRAGTGWKEGLVGHATVGTGMESQAGYTLKSDHPVIVRDLREETRFCGPPLLHDHGVVSGMSVIIQSTGQPWGILGVHTKEHREFNEDDISFIQSSANILALAIGRKRSEEELHRLERIVSTSTDMMAMLDKDFIYLAANPAYLEVFNKSPDELIGHSVPEVFGEEFFSERIRPNAERCLAGEEVNYQTWFDFPVYGSRYMDIHYYPYAGADNEVVGFVVNGRDITERKQSETAFQTIIKSAAEVSGQEFFTNTASSLCEWLGAECTIISEITKEGHARALGMQLDGKSVDQFEYDLSGTPCGDVITKGYCAYTENISQLFPDDGYLAEMQAEGYVGVSLKDRDAKPVGILCVISRRKLELHPKTQDVFEIIATRAATEIKQKQVETSLRQAKAEWDQSFDALSDHICILDMGGKILRANKSMRKRFEPKHGKLEGLDYRLIYCGTATPDPQPPCAAVLSGAGQVEVETTLPTIEGSYQVSSYPCLDEDGVQWGAVSVVRDITKRKQVEKALEGEQKQSRQIIDTARDAFVSMDADGIITDWNPQAEEMFGWSREEALGRLVVETIIPEESHEAHKKGLKHFLITGEGLVLNQHIEISAQHRDSHTIPVELSVVSAHSDGTINFNAFIRDIGERIQSREALEKSTEQLRTSLIGTVVAISRAVGARDPYTAGHQQRVSQLSRAIAQEMDLHAEQIDGLRMGASIHDIGKIYLPAEILSKPAKLTDIEYQLIKSHSQVGYDILKDVEFPWPVADIAHQHHEHLDGSGYPQGLKGDEICLEARIVAVADVVEAMSSHRPYRPSLGIDAALHEIESRRGKWFESGAVDACLKLFREKHFNFKDP